MFLIDCHKASIYTIDNDYLCDAIVSQITEESLLLTFKAPSADILRSEVRVTFYDNVRGLVSCSCALSGYKEYIDTPGNWHSCVTCTFREIIDTIQRRDDIKVHVDIPVTLHFTDSEGKNASAEAVIRDISAGGVFITSAYAFFTGEIIHFSFLTDSKKLHLKAEILRLDKNDINNKSPKDKIAPDQFGYGCRFIDVPSYVEASVRSFVYKQLARKKTL